MNSKLDGPLVGAFEADTDGVVKQEFITYRVRDGMLRKETTTRTFQANGKDWIDTSSVVPLVEVKNG
jgi:hypothetical protein